MTRRRGTRTPLAVASLVLAVGGSACTADPAPEPEPVRPVETSASAAAPPSILRVEPGPLDVRVVHVRGRLREPAAVGLRRSMRRAVGRWMAAGFTAGPLPRRDFSSAYASYTDGAARQARRQRAVTTNAALGPELVEVVPARRVARVSALGVGGRPVGASAQVLLVVVGARRDGSRLELVVRGELDLTPTGRGWKVFGFDLQRSVGAPGTYAGTTRRVREREQRRVREREQRRVREREQRRDRGQQQRPGGRSR